VPRRSDEYIDIVDVGGVIGSPFYITAGVLSIHVPEAKYSCGTVALFAYVPFTRAVKCAKAAHFLYAAFFVLVYVLSFIE